MDCDGKALHKLIIGEWLRLATGFRVNRSYTTNESTVGYDITREFPKKNRKGSSSSEDRFAREARVHSTARICKALLISI